MNRKSSLKKVSKPKLQPGGKPRFELGGYLLQTTVPTFGGENVGRVKAGKKVVIANEQNRPKPGSRKKSAPVKKIPNVHSAADLSSGAGADHQLGLRQLGQERQRNKILQVGLQLVLFNI